MRKIEKRVSLTQWQEHPAVFYTDLLAGFLFFVLLGWYIYVAFIGINVADESFYYTIPQRFFQGDRLFVDEWHVSQLSALFQLLPYRLFTLLTGGTDGVIVYMRFVGLAVTMAFYWFFYIRLRAYRIWGVLAAFLLCSFFPGGILAVNYYTVAIYMLAVTCIVLFLSEDALPMKRLILLGVVFSCAVLAQPIFAFLFLFYSILCLVRSRAKTLFRSFDFALNSRTWKGLFLGCLLSFLCFAVFMAVKSGVGNIVSTVPELFSDAEYDFTFGGAHIQALKYKIIGAFHYYGTPFSVSAAVLAIAALVYKRAKKESLKVKIGLFAAAGFLLLAEVICGILSFRKLVNGDDPSNFFIYCFFFNFPFTWFGLTCWGLCEKHRPRLFAFWLVGEAASVMIAYASEGFLTFGGEISNIGTVLLFGAVVEEFKEQLAQADAARKPGTKSTALQRRAAARAFLAARLVAAVGVCAIVALRSVNFYVQGIHPYVETQASSFSDKRIRAAVAKGPHKGIRTTQEMAEKYSDILEDLDRIAADSDGKAVYFAGNCPLYYLYLNLPYGTYSGWYVDRDSETRQCRYWELHPEKRPKYYYIPLSIDSLDFSGTWATERERLQEKLDFIQRLAVCNVTKGKAGYIVEIKEWL